MPPLQSAFGVCRRCIQRLSAATQPTSVQFARRNYSNAPISRKAPFRLAVIGSGPAGFYSAYRVMHKIPEAVVDMYERLPVPYGLVRFGVAPDHPEVKNCQDKFEEVASSPRFNFVGNINIGEDLPLTSLRPHYDAILFAYGASKDRRLGVQGEDLKGVYSARAFVNWYNGLPEYANLNPTLDAGDHAVIIGHGNVALDVARILLTDVDMLRKTDIAQHALDVLSKSRISRVSVVGRRGPMQASFTIKEVRELMNLRTVAFSPIDPLLLPPDASKLPRQQKRIVQVLQKGSPTPIESAKKSWQLQFLLSPISFDSSLSDNTTLAKVVCAQNTFSPNTDRFSRSASITQTKETIQIPASLAFRSVGYKSTALSGLADIGVPFDEKTGIIPNDMRGRVTEPESLNSTGKLTQKPGVYCAGWVKRGPTGVIASTMEDAFTSADAVAQDWEARLPFLSADQGGSSGRGWEAVREEAEKRGLHPVSWDDWKKIDLAEKERGRTKGKDREKITNINEMLRILDR